jgi:hypothetical protein
MTNERILRFTVARMMDAPLSMAGPKASTAASLSASGGRSRYRELWPERIVETAQQLVQRIQERFPGSGLGNVAVEVRQIAEEAVVRSEAIRRPNYWLRGSVFSLAAGMFCVLAAVIYTKVKPDEDVFKIEEFIQTLEAAIGSVVFLGAAVVFLVSLERRWKRERALQAIRELRALAHIVDMHQLTKDPESTLRGRPTESSPRRTLTQFELGRYLDYCSELLSLINKIGAIYVQEFPDAIALEAVDQLSNLTNGLSRNIWQKLMILDMVADAGKSPAGTPVAAAAGSLAAHVKG